MARRATRQPPLGSAGSEKTKRDKRSARQK